jgi:hypothetical protein
METIKSIQNLMEENESFLKIRKSLWRTITTLTTKHFNFKESKPFSPSISYKTHNFCELCGNCGSICLDHLENFTQGLELFKKVREWSEHVSGLLQESFDIHFHANNIVFRSVNKSVEQLEEFATKSLLIIDPTYRSRTESVHKIANWNNMVVYCKTKE